jgi:hypothetical protein
MRVNADTLHSTCQHHLHTPSAREIGLTSALMCAACQLTSLDSSSFAPLSSPRLSPTFCAQGIWERVSSCVKTLLTPRLQVLDTASDGNATLGIALSAVATSPPPFLRHVCCCSTQTVCGPERVELSAIRQGRDFCANSNVCHTPLFCAIAPGCL